MDEQVNISGQEKAIKNFMHTCLDIQKEGQTIDYILAELGRYYDADRSYIFEINGEYTRAGNTCEWCAQGVVSKMGKQQNIPLSLLKQWLEWFEKKGEFYISSSVGNESDSEARRMLELQEADCLMAAPIIVGEKTVGFLGMDNPRRNTGDLLLLSVAASVCYREISARRRVDAKLEQTEKEITDRVRIIQSLGKIYTSVYSIDMASGQFTELSSLQPVHAHIGASGDAQERLNYFCHHMIQPEYTDAMLQFVDISTLDERLAHTRIISKQYQSTLFSHTESGDTANWNQCSFIEGDRDAAGRLAHIIFTTQSVNEAKAGELADQKRLHETNANLTTLLAEEKQYTAIIGAMSNVYFGLYYIDLEKNTFQELISLDKIHHTLGEKGDAREVLKHMTNELAGDAYQPLMLKFTDFDTIDERLGDRPIIVQEYAARTGGWT